MFHQLFGYIAKFKIVLDQDVLVEVEAAPKSYGLTIHLLRFEFLQLEQTFTIELQLEIQVECDSEVKIFSGYVQSSKCSSFENVTNNMAS